MIKKILLVASSVLISVSTVAFVVIELNKPNKVYHIVTFDSKGGTPVQFVEVEHGKKISEPVVSKLGYQIQGWLNEETLWSFSTDVVVKDMELTASWNAIEYTITYNTTGGEMPETYEATYTIESDFDLARPEKGGSVFIGWFDKDGNRIDSIMPGMTGAITVEARWTNDLILVSEDETRGTINAYASETTPNEYTVANNPVNNKHHLFKGWYDKDGNLLSTNPEYTFTVNPNVTNYIFSRYMNDEEELSWNNTHGVVPQVLSTKVIYGLYPQSNVNDETLIDILDGLKSTRFNGYYYYNHEYYAKKVARLARDLETHELLSIRQFDNGDEFIEDETYWFKVEPISWKILKESSNQYNLVSEKLLDVQRYHRNSSTRIIDEKTIYANNYKYSDVRKWLNEDFKNNAFAFYQNNLLEREIDNSKETTASPDSGFECENTDDYVTLLSYKEYNEKSIFDRQSITTDYTRVSGANYSVEYSNLFSGYCWTRSPIESRTEKGEIDKGKNGTAVSRCNINGTLNSDFVGWGGSCAQPSIKISK